MCKFIIERIKGKFRCLNPLHTSLFNQFVNPLKDCLGCEFFKKKEIKKEGNK